MHNNYKELVSCPTCVINLGAMVQALSQGFAGASAWSLKTVVLPLCVDVLFASVDAGLLSANVPVSVASLWLLAIAFRR